jgi:hypothetical protein
LLVWRKPLPELALKCTASWKKYFPSYEIKEWNETNYDVYKIPYISEAYNVKKYAFVSDYARFDILYQYGGIYFDTDVEVIKPFDDILARGGFIGIEPGLCIGCHSGLGIGCNSGLSIVHQILDFYASAHFINTDGAYNLHTVVEYVTAILKRNGFKSENSIQHLDGITVYPVEYFNPINYWTHRLEITEKTHSIHHYAASWITVEAKKEAEFIARLCRIFGIPTGRVLASLFCGVKNLPKNGPGWFWARVKYKLFGR